MKAIVFLLTIVCFLFSSCTRTFIYPSYQSPEFSLTKSKGKKWLVYTSPQVSILEFKRSFERSYGDGMTFADQFTSQLMDSIAPLKIRVVHSKMAIHPEGLELSIQNKRIDKKNILPNDTTGPEYIVFISNVVINNALEGYYRAPMMMAGGGMVGGGGGSTESCVVSFQFSLIDAVSGATVVTFKSIGDYKVAFFDYENTLHQAIRKSISHAVTYLKSGKVKFFEL